MANSFLDMDPLAKLSAGDLTAIEAEYHPECVTSFKNLYHAQQRQQSWDDTESDEVRRKQAHTLQGLIMHVETMLEDDSVQAFRTSRALHQTSCGLWSGKANQQDKVERP